MNDSVSKIVVKLLEVLKIEGCSRLYFSSLSFVYFIIFKLDRNHARLSPDNLL